MIRTWRRSTTRSVSAAANATTSAPWRPCSERIPQEVVENLQWVRGLLDHFDAPSDRRDFMKRIKRHFNRQKKVTEQTLAAIDGVGDDIAAGLDAAIRSTRASHDRAPN